MKSVFLAAVLATIVVVGMLVLVFVDAATNSPCVIRIHYDTGTFEATGLLRRERGVSTCIADKRSLS